VCFLTHMGKDLNSAYRIATTCLENLKNQSCHIKKIVKRQTTQEILNNWLYSKASIDIVCWLTFQSCAFRGYNERPESKNRNKMAASVVVMEYKRVCGWETRVIKDGRWLWTVKEGKITLFLACEIFIIIIYMQNNFVSFFLIASNFNSFYFFIFILCTSSLIVHYYYYYYYFLTFCILIYLKWATLTSTP